MEEQNKSEYIDLRLIFRRLWHNKWKFIIILPIVGVLTAGYTLCLPDYYTSELKLVPEIGGTEMGGTLGDLASSFGIDLSNTQSSDAISPLLYPDLMEDNGFVASLFDIHVKSGVGAEMQVDTTYYWYLKKFQKNTPWYPIVRDIKKIFKKKKKNMGNGKALGETEYDPYYVSEDDDGLMNKIRDDITFNIDKKTAVITLAVQTQDPYICRCLADSIRERLQTFIIDYRTSKARVDESHYEKLTKKAKVEYEQSIKAYADLVDANQEVVLQSERSKQDELENDMQNKYNAYSALLTQWQAAQAKVQECTPAFTLLKGASVPIKHTGPKRTMIVLAFVFLAFLCIAAHCLKDDIKKQLSKKVE